MADGDFDMASALSSMADTFGGGGADGGEGAAGGASPPAADPGLDASASPATPSPNSGTPSVVPDSWGAPPKAWPQTMHPHWGSLTPDVRKYLYDREDQVLRGITDAKKAYDPYDAVNKKYGQWFDHYKVGADQVPKVYEQMLGSHLTLLHAPEEIKKAAVQALIRDYKLDDILRGFYGAGGQPSAQPGIDPMKLVQQAIGPLQERFQHFSSKFEEREQKETMDMIAGFLAKPENEMAKELIPDMVQLLDSKAATTLEQAFEMAKWNNPSSRAKLIAKEVEAAAKPTKPAPRVVTPSAQPPSPTSRKGATMDDTLARVLQDIQSRS